MKTAGPLQGTSVVISRCGAGEAELVRSLLESCGIPCLIGCDITRGVYPLTVPELGEVRVSVPAAAAEEAVAILRASPLAAPRPNGPVLRLIEGGLSKAGRR